MEKSQIELLADYIMAEIPGEPSRSEGAGDTAIRLLKELRLENEQLRQTNAAMRHDLVTTHGLHAMDSPIADERAFEIKHPSLAG